MAKKQSKDDKDLIELGKKLQDFYDTGYINRKDVLWFSFLKGIASGVGAFLGGTIVIALLLWILSLFQDFPLLSNLVHMIQRALNS